MHFRTQYQFDALIFVLIKSDVCVDNKQNENMNKLLILYLYIFSRILFSVEKIIKIKRVYLN